MAKKKGVNIIFSQLDKIVLCLALIFLGWVLYSRFIRSTGVEMNGRIVRASDAAKMGANEAQEIEKVLEREKVEDGTEVLKYTSHLDAFLKARLQPALEADRIALNPVNMIGHELPEEKRLYQVPGMLSLREAKLGLTHAPAMAPATESEISAMSTRMVGEGVRPFGGGVETGIRVGSSGPVLITKDVDFVTVEAVFPLGQLRTSYRQSFSGPQVEKPLEEPDPVVSSVVLERSRLLPDGAWSEWERVKRLRVDPMYEKDLPTERFSEINRTEFDVMLANRRSISTQRLLLQPKPYNLVNNAVWRSPSDQETYEEELKKERKSAGVLQPGGQSGSGATGFDSGMNVSDSSGGGFGMASPRGGAIGGNEASAMESSWNQIEDIHLWAHDGDVAPGEIYRYRLKVGFFNPIAGHNWFTEGQTDLKDQIVLWTNWISPDQVVQIPPGVTFFPVAAANGQLRVEVYRWQTDRWYKDRFMVSAGSQIGEVSTVKEDNRSSGGTSGVTNPPAQEIDFSTEMTLIDVIDDCQHWCRTGRRLQDVKTADIVYRDTDGQIHRVGVHKLCWPDEWVRMKSQIDKSIRDRTRETQTPNRGDMGGDSPGGGGASER